MNKQNYIFIDLDGVILDSEERILKLKANYPELSWSKFSEIIDWSKLLRESEEINDAIKIIKELESRQEKIAILTKVHSLLEAESKVIELRKNRKLTTPILFTPSHIKKSEIYCPNNGEILVDDSIKNIEDWNLHGGTGFLFQEKSTSEKNVVRSLKFLL